MKLLSVSGDYFLFSWSASLEGSLQIFIHFIFVIFSFLNDFICVKKLLGKSKICYIFGKICKSNIISKSPNEDKRGIIKPKVFLFFTCMCCIYGANDSISIRQK